MADSKSAKSPIAARDNAVPNTLASGPQALRATLAKSPTLTHAMAHSFAHDGCIGRLFLEALKPRATGQIDKKDYIMIR